MCPTCTNERTGVSQALRSPLYDACMPKRSMFTYVKASMIKPSDRHFARRMLRVCCCGERARSRVSFAATQQVATSRHRDSLVKVHTMYHVAGLARQTGGYFFVSSREFGCGPYSFNRGMCLHLHTYIPYCRKKGNRYNERVEMSWTEVERWECKKEDEGARWLTWLFPYQPILLKTMNTYISQSNRAKGTVVYHAQMQEQQLEEGASVYKFQVSGVKISTNQTSLFCLRGQHRNR